MIKKILFGILGVVGAFVLVAGVLALLVALNRLPVLVASRLPFVHTHIVEGDVRMTDGKSLPTAPVTVEVKSSKGRTLRAKATEKNNYHYSVAFMGFGMPLSSDDSVRIRALMDDLALSIEDANVTEPAPAVAQASAPAPSGAAPKPEEKKKAKKSAKRILLADFEISVSGVHLESDTPILTNARLRTNDASQPSTLVAWKDTPLGTLANLPDLPLDGSATLVAEIQPFDHDPADAPFHLQLPPAVDEAELRAMPLSRMGEEVGRQMTLWQKKRASVPFRYSLPHAASVSVQIVDARGNVVRNQRVGIPGEGSYPKSLTWDWDGRDASGAYVPEGEYTFVASADSLELGTAPQPFMGKITAQGTERIRYAEFSASSTIGDLLDAFALTVQRDVGRRGAPTLRLNESLSVFVARESGKPTTSEKTFKGEQTVGDLLDAFEVELDGVARGSVQEGSYNLSVRGGELRGKVVPTDMRPTAQVKTLPEFLRLPLRQVNVVKDAGKTIPLVSGASLELNAVREQTRREVEEWERPQRETTAISLTPENTVQDLLDEINAVSGISGKILPPGSGERYQYDAQIVGPNGSRVRFYRPGDTASTAGHLTANIRAAGLLAEARAEGLPKPLLADGTTTVPIHVTAIGMDGKPLEKDELTASAAKGTFGNGGYLQRVGEFFEVAYTTPALPENETATVTVVSQTLRSQEAGENITVPSKATVELELAGVRSALTPTSPVAGETSANGEAIPVSSQIDESLPAEEETQQPLQSPADSDTVAGSVAGTSEGTDPRKMAKIYAKMAPAQAAELLLALPQSQARAVVRVLKDRDAAKIFDAALATSEEDSADAGDPSTAAERRRKKQQLVELISGGQ